MSSEAVIQYKEWPCLLRLNRYADNGRTAIRLIHAEEGDLVSTATINMPEVELADDEVIIKDYSENKGMLSTLVRAGIVEDTGRTVQTGWVESPVCRLLAVTA